LRQQHGIYNNIMIQINVVYQKEVFPFELEEDDRFSIVLDFLCELTPLSRDNCTLIYKGKKISPFCIAKDAIPSGAKIMIIGSTHEEVDRVKRARADPLVKGFDALERDERARRKRTKRLQKSFWGTKQHADYKFCSFKAEFKYTTPTPYDAEALLKKLAGDPGIVKIMTERKFVVGVLEEMSPQEAQERMAREGKHGDLLGFNQNFGQKIVLRLRTDDVKGFRPYYDLINTLIHELTHNVFGPHDGKFWALFRELKKDYDVFHDSWSRGGRTIGGETAEIIDDSSDDDGPSMGGGKVGGDAPPVTAAEARLIAAQRAEERASLGIKPQSTQASKTEASEYSPPTPHPPNEKK